jgi:hypothetical protein
MPPLPLAGEDKPTTLSSVGVPKTTKREEKSFRIWITIGKASDVPGQWAAHCLDVDVVTYGNSPRHAFDMVQEAVAMVIEDDLNRGADPTDRVAPAEDWIELADLNKRARRMPLSAWDEAHEATYVINLQLHFWRPLEKPRGPPASVYKALAEKQVLLSEMAA